MQEWGWGLLYSGCIMAKPRLSHLQRAVQHLGLENEKVIPDVSKVSDAELQAPFAKYLSVGECHEDLGIRANFDPTKLPSVSFSQVRNSTDYARPYAKDGRSLLLNPYFSTISVEESAMLMSVDRMTGEALLDADDFLRCRLFFQSVVLAIKQGYHIVILNNKEHTLPLFLHVKELRKLPGTDQRESKETILMEVEYYSMSHEEAYARKRFTRKFC